MNKIFAAILLAFVIVPAANAAEQASVSDISENHEIIQLDDGSVWEVKSYDVFEVSTWLVAEDVVINDDEDQLYNIDDQSSVDVQRIR